MRTKILAFVGVLAMAGGMAMAARPGEHSGRGQGMNPEMLKERLGLSDQQVTELKKLLGDHRKAEIRRHADLAIARTELHELMDAATVDEKAVDAKVKAIGALQQQALDARIKSMLAGRKVLTPEQYQKFKELRSMHPRGPRQPGSHGPRDPRRGPGGPGDPGAPGDDEDGGEEPLTQPQSE